MQSIYNTYGMLMNRTSTFFLFAVPSFLSGLGRAVDLGGTFDWYNMSPHPELADTRAISSDWTAVGDDLRSAMSEARVTAKAKQLELDFSDPQP